jgi:predicted ribosomally synthesized peptide with nif11-like leader
MENMKKLYEKVSADSTLQAKFEVIMNAAEKAGQEVTEEKLVTFAKEAGYDVTLEEMQQFFKNMSETGNTELSAQELDMVAGGKAGVMPVVSSVLSMGVTCATGSLAYVIGGHKCKEYYEHQGM